MNNLAFFFIACLVCVIQIDFIYSTNSGSKDESLDKNQTKASFDKSNDQKKFQEELRSRQIRARKEKLLREKRQNMLLAVRKTIDADKSEKCSWITDPIANLQGKLCGTHYKVLGLDRRKGKLDKPTIKKSYRKLSLLIHPDKNPSPKAENAFTILQNAYECLTDEQCKEKYDEELLVAEEHIYWNRQRMKHYLIEKSLHTLGFVHYYLSMCANYIFNAGTNLWDIAGEWKIRIGDSQWPLGKPILLGFMLWKGQLFLKLHLVSYALVFKLADILHSIVQTMNE